MKLMKIKRKLLPTVTLYHWGKSTTGDLDLSISSASEFEMAKNLIRMAYEGRTKEI